jgi:hypothetical protein
VGTKSRRVKISAIDVVSVTAPFTFMRPPQPQISGLIPRDLNMSWVARIQYSGGGFTIPSLARYMLGIEAALRLLRSYKHGIE